MKVYTGAYFTMQRKTAILHLHHQTQHLENEVRQSSRGTVVGVVELFPVGGSSQGKILVRSQSHWGSASVCLGHCGCISWENQTQPTCLIQSQAVEWTDFQEMPEGRSQVGNFLCKGQYVPLTNPSSMPAVLIQKVEWVSEDPNQANTGPSSGPGFTFNEGREAASDSRGIAKTSLCFNL